MHELVTSGLPFEMGRQHGQHLRSQIEEAMQARLPGLAHVKDSLVLEICDRIRKAFPWLIEEMKGIADGAGIDFSKLAKFAFADDLQAVRLCVAVGTVNGEPGPIFAKTIETGTPHEFTVHTARPDSGNSLVGMGKLGNVRMSAGINSVGLGTGLVTVGGKDAPGDGIPILILVRAVLQLCDTVEEACELLADHGGLVSGYSMLLIDAAGGICVVEKSPKSQAVRHPDDGCMFNTVFLHPDMQEVQTNPPDYQVKRAVTLEKLCRALPREPALEDMRDIIAYREGEGPINDPAIPIAVSLLGSCKDRFMDVAAGRPDEAEFVRYSCD